MLAKATCQKKKKKKKKEKKKRKRKILRLLFYRLSAFLGISGLVLGTPNVRL